MRGLGTEMHAACSCTAGPGARGVEVRGERQRGPEQGPGVRTLDFVCNNRQSVGVGGTGT